MARSGPECLKIPETRSAIPIATATAVMKMATPYHEYLRHTIYIIRAYSGNHITTPEMATIKASKSLPPSKFRASKRAISQVV
jgi:hypothetical protein